jgi:hypothetical protein
MYTLNFFIPGSFTMTAVEAKFNNANLDLASGFAKTIFQKLGPEYTYCIIFDEHGNWVRELRATREVVVEIVAPKSDN